MKLFSSRRLRRLTLQILIISFIGFAVRALFEVWILYNAFNLRVISNLKIPFKVTQLKFEDNIQKTGLMCNSSCYIWNPAIVKYKGEFLVAARESTRQQCSGLFGTIGMLVSLTRPAISSVVFGKIAVSDSDEVFKDGDKFTTVVVQTRITSPIPFNPEAYHSGTEDPRWRMTKDGLQVVFSLLENGVATVSTSMLKSTNPMDFSGITTYKKILFEKKQYPQKNWLFFPNTNKFIYTLNPLVIAEISGEGSTSLFYSAGFNEKIPSRLRGGALIELNMEDDALIEGTTKDNEGESFLVICHTSFFSYSNLEIKTAVYSHYVIRVVLKNDIYRITHLSEPFSFPVFDNDIYGPRISFPMGIVLGKWNVIVSHGSNDCTSHLTRFQKTDFLSLLKPLKR
jgi:predicted GH43/DUF377 family glycosyl hydrolase